MKLWPFTRTAPAPETKSFTTASSWDELITGSAPSVAGIAVTSAEAMQVPVVANAVQLISEAVASLDVMVKRIDGTSEIDVPDHPLLPLLRGDANDWTSGFELIRQIVQDALTRDAGGMVWVNRPNGEARELVRYRHGFISFEVDQNTGERRYKLSSNMIPARDVIHLLPPLGRAPLTLAREAIGIAVALDRHAARLFSRGARPSGALTFPTGIGESAVKSGLAAWRQAHEGEDRGRTAVLPDGITFQPYTFNSTDAQFLENRRFQIEEIARIFNIPAPMVGDLSRATWSNSEQKGREFLSYTLEPWLRGLEGAMRRALFSDAERADHVIRFDRDDLTRADLATRATVINSLIASRTINSNEGRSWIGLPPRAGGDEFLNPNITSGPPPAAPPAKEPTDEPE
ncbi:phage portal protein [Szabonella alba]|uniref:Phage portal protein n=1 Tax=Szabonella alba TaxID=2804194 RepID=A0A8K0VH13_9RHOB|nr:phage portal protein [Szabonella alba]MBL4919317.1 phage portal protein [Szabonella alba]